MDCPDGELSILLVGDDQIAELNRQYLQREGSTNVIAFPMRNGAFTHVTPQLLGDVVISTDTAQREGDASGDGFEWRLIELLVHGVLHLFGYDHERGPDHERAMRAKSEALLKQIETAVH